MSEVALLRQRIEMECAAMRQAMQGFRVTASHDIINNQYTAIGNIQEELADLVGEREAALIAVEAYIQVLG